MQVDPNIIRLTLVNVKPNQTEYKLIRSILLTVVASLEKRMHSKVLIKDRKSTKAKMTPSYKTEMLSIFREIRLILYISNANNA